MKYIEPLWQKYESDVLPKNASEVQRRECKRAFFAGALGLFSTILGFLEPGAEATDADLRRMDHVNEELEEYFREVEAERQ